MASYDRHVRVEIDYTVGKKQKMCSFASSLSRNAKTLCEINIRYLYLTAFNCRLNFNF